MGMILEKNVWTLELSKNGIAQYGPEYDQSRIFDIRPKPKFSFKKMRPSAEDISRSRRYEVSFSSPNSEVKCIKYDILDFCNHLLVTANFAFENNRVLL